jgi:very-short-patch-repair endonuclease
MPSRETLLRLARENRKHLTPTETVLWPRLRDRRFARFKFRRQHVLEPFIVDYYCASCRLVIELDGETHIGREVEDLARQQDLERRGLKFMRFWNTQIFDELDSVLEAIFQECERRLAALTRDQPFCGDGEPHG